MTTIEWTDATWNPVTGCDSVSPGCNHCYAMTMAKRLKAMGQPRYQRDGDPRTSGPGFGVTLHEDVLGLPLRWRRPRRVFVNSMSDLFHPDVPDSFIGGVFDVMARSPQHTFQILTKRPQRMERLLSVWYAAGVWRRHDMLWCGPVEFPLPNVWLGTSIESNRYVFRADHLRRTPAAVRFVSAEPLLGPLDELDLTGIDWLIVGGESGPGARPMHPAWVRDLLDRCHPAEHPCAGSCLGCGAGPDEACIEPCRCDEGEDCHVAAARRPAFFFKQWGEWVPYEMDPQPPFWQSQHGELIDGHRLPADLSEPGVHDGWRADDDLEDEPVVWRRVGKKAAGRLLDGREWSEYPPT